MKRYHLAIVYIFSVLYVSFSPFDLVDVSQNQFFDWLYNWSFYVRSYRDLIENIMLYLPLGFIITALIRPKFKIWGFIENLPDDFIGPPERKIAIIRYKRFEYIENLPKGFVGPPEQKFSRTRTNSIRRILIAVAFCFCMSAIIETLQRFSAARIPDPMDIVANSLGALIGGIVEVYLTWEPRAVDIVHRFQKEHMLNGRIYTIGLLAIVLWTFSELAPFIPTFDPEHVKHGLKPLWNALNSKGEWNPIEAAVYFFNIAGLGTIAAASAQIRFRGLLGSQILCGNVLLATPFIVGRQLTLEALLGYIAVVILAAFTLLFSRRDMLVLSALLIIAGFVCYELQPGITSWRVVNEYNWLPFGIQSVHELTGFRWILSTLWPFVALSFLSHLLFPERRVVTLIAGCIILSMLTFGMEWLQRFIPGRFPDITVTILALAGWSGPFYWRWQSNFERQKEMLDAEQVPTASAVKV